MVEKMAFQIVIGQTVLQATSIDAVLFVSAIIAVWFLMPRIMGMRPSKIRWGFDEPTKLADVPDHQPH